MRQCRHFVTVGHRALESCSVQEQGDPQQAGPEIAAYAL
jgi:hypothetical protein